MTESIVFGKILHYIAGFQKLGERNDRSPTVRLNSNDRSPKSIVINEISFAMKKTSNTDTGMRHSKSAGHEKVHFSQKSLVEKTQ